MDAASDPLSNLAVCPMRRVAWLGVATIVLGFYSPGPKRPELTLCVSGRRQVRNARRTPFPDRREVALLFAWISMSCSDRMLTCYCLSFQMDLLSKQGKLMHQEAKGLSAKKRSYGAEVVAGEVNSNITFAAGQSAVVGTIAFGGKMYRLRSAGKGVRVVERVDPRRITGDSAPPRAQSRKLMMVRRLNQRVTKETRMDVSRHRTSAGPIALIGSM